MSEINFFLLIVPLAIMIVMATLGWIISIAIEDVSIVDSMWSLFFLAGAISIIPLVQLNYTLLVFLAALTIWSVRLSAHLTYRNWGQVEDHRYQTIRGNNQPNFEIKSLFLIFYLQAILAWLIAVPVFTILSTKIEFNLLGLIGLGTMVFGIIFESIADYQLLRFIRSSKNSKAVLDTGLWRYSRHPNYFGECCVWWGVYFIAASAGFAWTIFSPILLTFLILKISGVAMTENTITQRRPAYRAYMQRTSAFIPLPPLVNRERVTQ